MNSQNRKTKDLHVMVTPEQHEKVKVKSAENRMTISDFIMGLVEKGYVKSALSSNQLALLRAASGVATNINQISKALNKGSTDKVTIAMAETTIEKLNSLLDSIRKPSHP